MQESPIAGGIGRYFARRGVDFPLHSHQQWELVYYVHGRLMLEVGDRRFETGAGVLVCTPPRVPHAESAIDDYDNIFFEVEALESTPWPVVVHDDASGRILRVFESLLDEGDGDGEGDGDDRMRQLLMEQLDLLIRRYADREPASSSPAALVSRAELALRENIASPPTLALLARELGVAPSTLRLAFQRERGMSARDRMRALRLQRALGLLRTSTMTLEHIADLCGYASASHLSHVVKAETGRTPGRLRRDGF